MKGRGLVIADDITGAAEIAGIAVRYGITTRIVTDPAALSDAASDILTVFDSESRLAVPTTAHRLIATHATSHTHKPGDVLYKKTDSVLRGPVLAEIEAFLLAARTRAALLLPQNPSRRRIIDTSGQYLIDGVPLDQTGFANDPHHPAWTSDALKRLGQSELLATRFAPAGTAADPLQDGITLAGATTLEEVRRWAKHAREADVLCAGGADLFEAIVSVGRSARDVEAVTSKPNTLAICGSVSTAAREFARWCESHGVPVRRFPVTQLGSNAPGAAEAAMRACAAQVVSSLKSHGVAMLAPSLDSATGLARHIEAALAEVFVRVCRDHVPARALIDGGATAAACFGALHVRELAVLGEIAPGVVRLNGGAADLELVIKPGSYRWPDGLMPSGKA
jgi:D-threonate/D-erythronate kinase